MGKRVIEAADGPGFLVNRCNRPWGLESLKLLAERVATVEQIDRICRLGGGFRMGPFELMDLVGVDVGLDIARSFYEQSFGEPRWQPSPITVRTVAAGRTGRKSGRGFYEYPESGIPPGADPDPPPRGGGDGLVVIAGESALALELERGRRRGRLGGGDAEPRPMDGPAPFLILEVTLDGEEPEAPLQGGPQAICCAAGSLAALDPGGSAVGFHALPPLDAGDAGRAHPRPRHGGVGRRGGRALLHHPGQAHRVGGRRSRAGSRPHRLPGGQRGRVRARRGRGQRRGHRRGHDPWPQLPARDPRLGRRDRA